MKSRTTLHVGLVTVVLPLVLLVAAGQALAQSPKRLPALTPTPRDSLTHALASGELTPAEYALERATALFHPVRVAARYGTVRPADPRAATLILRDLAIRVRYLSGADRQRALALLARPTDNPNPDDGANTYGATVEQTPVCGTNVCIHYVITGPHAVDTTDTTPANGIPDYVDEALDVFENTVWAQEVTTKGYRAPKSDITSVDNGASASDPTGAKFDVYLAQLGDDGLYGYCTSDDPHLQGGYTFFDMSAYCVVDNNYTESIFDAHTPLENLEVTAAHEFFHAVQYSYDAFEDQWFLESTATWMEDEIYDTVNDNVQYLPDGPLGKPRTPLDKAATNKDPCCHVYGDWIFFRYLTEKYGPGIVKSSWNKADASEDTDGPGPDGVGQDMYSVQAVAKTLSTKGGFRKNFANFGWANRISRRVYQEGKANAYPQAPLSDPATTLSGSNRSKSQTMTLDHQTNAYLEFKRGSGLSSTVKLKLSLNLPSKTAGSAASVLVYMKNGTVSPFTLGITSAGDGDFKVPFGSSVKKVDLVLTNGSTRYTNCYPAHHPTPYACNGGTPRDDGMAYELTAHV